MRYIIVGKSCYQTFLKCYIPHENDYFIGLDDGAFTILDNGFLLKEAWGDFDSSTRLKELEENNIKVYKYSINKNETDLELVLMNHQFKGEILIYDVTGGRLDHEFVNLLLLKKYKNLDIKIIDLQNEIRYLSKPGVYSFNKEKYNYVSILTLHEAKITITKAEYCLENTKITINDTFTTSNSFKDDKFEMELFSGEIILIRSI